MCFDENLEAFQTLMGIRKRKSDRVKEDGTLCEH